MKLAKIETSTFKYDDAEFTIKNLLSGDIAEINQEALKIRIVFEEDENGDSVPVRSMTPDRKAETELIVLKSITDWENINDDKGEKLDCTDRNKKRFCAELPDEVFKEFYLKLNEEREKLSDAVIKQAEKKVKN